MAERVNQQIADALTERQMRAGRVERTLREQAWTILALLEAEITAALKANDPTEFALLARRRRAVDTLMAEEMEPLIVARYARLARLLDEAMGRLATQEAKALERIVNGVTEEETIEATPSEATLTRRVAATLIPTATRPTDLSTTGADWWERQGSSLAQRIGDQLLVAVALEETLTQATARIRGTRANGFQDGIMAKAREDAARLVTTQVTNAVSEARMATGERNPDKELIAIHQSVLDSRTSQLCLGRHGLQYTLPDHTPIHHAVPYLNGPPYHPSCRSSMVIGLRGHGSIMQESLSAWLRRQGPAFQNEVLGPTRAQLFRTGRLGSPRHLLDATTGKPLTLEELGA